VCRSIKTAPGTVRTALADYVEGASRCFSISQTLKRTEPRDFLTLFFFIKQLLLVPLDMPRKDFKVFRIFEELFVFVIDSSVYSPPGIRDSQCIHHQGALPRNQPKLVYKRTLLVQNTLGSQDSPVINTPESLDSLVYYSPASFFVNLFCCLFKVH
jgi:hypothetical protein